MPNGAAQEKARQRKTISAGDEHQAAVGDPHSAQIAPLYGIDERPERLWECIVYGWQHTLVDISPFILPLAVAVGLGFDAVETTQLISFGLVAMGLATLLQTTIGNRLPIIQGPSATLIGVLAPLASQVGGAVMWAAVFVGGLVEAALGALRWVGWLRRFLPPVVSGTVIAAIGLSLGQLAIRLALGEGRSVDITLALTVIALVLLLQLGARRFYGGLLSRGAVFVSIWLVGLGFGSLVGEVNWGLVAERPWFATPQLFPHGGPGFGWEFSLAAVLVVLAGYFGSLVESLGDYAATCQVAGVRYTKKHMNRGILAEGLGASLSAVLGGLPCTSYTQNIGIIATTRVASRFVVQIAATILLLYGLCPKFGALLVAMPRSVLGGVFVLICGSIIVAGVRLLAQGDAGRFGEREGIVVGVTLVLSSALPAVIRQSLGQEWLDQQPTAVALLLTNSVVVAVISGMSLQLLLGGRRGDT